MFAVFHSARKALRHLVIPFAALTLAACDPIAVGSIGSGNIGQKVDTDAPIPVAMLLPLGSGSASDALLAQSLENAARLAMRDLQGARIDLRIYSTAANAATAATMATKAVDDGAKIILGPVYGASANAVGNAVAGRNVNVLSFSNNAAIAGGNVFVLGPTFQNTANRLVSFAKSQGKDRIVVVSARNQAETQGAAAIRQAIASSGATLAGSVEYDLSQQGVVDAAPRVKAAVDSGGANAVFLTSNSASALPLFAQLLPEAGLSPSVTQFIGLTRWDIPPQTLSLPGVQNGWFALPDTAATQAFEAKYRSAYGSAPHPIAGLGFDGIAAIGALVSTGRSNALTSTALTQGSGFRGATGIFRLTNNGTNQRGLAVATIRNNQVVVISAAPQAFGGAGF